MLNFPLIFLVYNNNFYLRIILRATAGSTDIVWNGIRISTRINIECILCQWTCQPCSGYRVDYQWSEGMSSLIQSSPDGIKYCEIIWKYHVEYKEILIFQVPSSSTFQKSEPGTLRRQTSSHLIVNLNSANIPPRINVRWAIIKLFNISLPVQKINDELGLISALS